VRAQGTDQDLNQILSGARERVDHFYRDLQRVAWTDTIRQQALKDNRTPKGKPREVTYDMLVRLEIPKGEDRNAPFYIRDVSELIRVDGRAATAKDFPISTNTNPAVLGVLHPLQARGDLAAQFHFAYLERATMNGRQTHVVTFHRETISHYSGRIWIDAETYDVRQIAWKPDLPSDHSRFVSDLEVTASLKPILFDNPKQTQLVFDSMTIVSVRNGNLFQETHTFGNYKRFTSEVTIVPAVSTQP
jgi:hypothetical protein